MSSIPQLITRYKFSPKITRHAKDKGHMSQSIERDFEMTDMMTPTNKDMGVINIPHILQKVKENNC